MSAEKSKLMPEIKKISNESNRNIRIQSNVKLQIWKRIRKFIILSQICFCAPMGAHRLDVENAFSARLQWPGQYLHLIYCLLLYAILVLADVSEFVKISHAFSLVRKPLFATEFATYIVNVLQIIYHTYHQRHQFVQFYKHCCRFELHFLEFGAAPKYERLTRFLIIFYIFMLVGYVSIISWLNYWSYFIHGGVWKFLRSNIVFILPNAVINVLLLQYYALLFSISKRSEDLYQILRLELERGGPELHGNLQRLRLLYSQLDFFTKQVNDSFGLSLLLVFFSSYVIGTFQLFLIYNMMYDRANILDYMWLYFSGSKAFIHFAKMFLILFYNHRIQVQKNIALLALSDFKAQNKELHESVKRFILQLSVDTRSNVICGVIVLNMDFVKSILVSSSTLFMFLLQYETTYSALSKNFNENNPT